MTDAMIKPPTPADEDQRLQTLRSLGVLDSPSEERFDRITRIASNLFDVPIALVSLVDADRQWFKSAQGLEASETPRDISFCGHAILHEETLVVTDATGDERFADNPLVTDDPHIRFYAGRPVHAHDGLRVGTLCLIDRKPRQIGERELEMLDDLAHMVEAELRNAALASTDPLTRISNRRGFEILSEQALAMAAVKQSPVALLYVDLDDFKEINDRHGHAAGDQALIEMAALLLRAFRHSDVVARLGGDEFGVLLSGISETELRLPIERLEQAVARRNEASNAPFELRCSIGVVTHRMDVERTLADLMEEADRRMYEVKRARKEVAPASGPR